MNGKTPPPETSESTATSQESEPVESEPGEDESEPEENESEPMTTGNYWHHVDGVPTKWSVAP